MRRYALRDDQWDRIKEILPGREGHVGGTAADNRLFVKAGSVQISRRRPLARTRALWQLEDHLYSASTGAPRAAFSAVFRLLASDHDNEYMMIDATIVRAHQHSAGTQKNTARKPSADPAAD